jgi:hypothetical protein
MESVRKYVGDLRGRYWDAVEVFGWLCLNYLSKANYTRGLSPWPGFHRGQPLKVIPYACVCSV